MHVSEQQIKQEPGQLESYPLCTPLRVYCACWDQLCRPVVRFRISFLLAFPSIQFRPGELSEIVYTYPTPGEPRISLSLCSRRTR